MKKIVSENFTFERVEISYEEAQKVFENEPFKLELIQDYEKNGKSLSIYKLGTEWCDLCVVPHIIKTGVVKAVKIINIAAAYWKGNERADKNKYSGNSR